MAILGNGQVAASLTAILNLSGATNTGPLTGPSHVGISFCNTSASLSQTILVTYQNSGGTQRRLARVVLLANEQAKIDNFPIQVGDQIFASSTNATTVDYLVYEDPGTSATAIVALDATGAQRVAQGTSSSVSNVITSSSANALAVGPAGITNPSFNVDASTVSAVTGLNIKSAAGSAGLAVTVTSTSGAENLTVDAKGTGTITLNGTATGNVIMGANLQMTDAKNVVLATTTGTTIGTSTTQKLSFWNATPIVQPTNATDLYNVLVNTGLIASGGAPPFSPPGTVTIADTKNIVLAVGTGTQIGTSTTQKLGFYGATPVVQPVASTNSTTGTTGSATGVSLDTTFKGSSGSSAYTIGGVVTQLKALGLIAA
jgi:hypothetical protein